MFEFFRPVLEFDNPVKYAIPFFILLMSLEAYLSYRERSDNYKWKDSVASLSMGLGSMVCDLLGKAIAFLVFMHIYEATGFFKEELSYTALGWCLLFVADDFSFYWHHRSSHEVRILWAAHVNHHSSEHYNLSTALRQSWAEVFYKYLLFYSWLPLVGFHPLMVFTQISFSLIYQFWIHTKYIRQLPPVVEFLFNTPAHHRLHHASNVRYLDKNHGGILIIWDRMFGTFGEMKPDEPIQFGITTNIHTFNPLRIASHEFIAIWRDVRTAPTWSDKLKYIINPPGWSHDGRSQTATEMQANLPLQQPPHS